jgi:hypothetical protein
VEQTAEVGRNDKGGTSAEGGISAPTKTFGSSGVDTRIHTAEGTFDEPQERSWRVHLFTGAALSTARTSLCLSARECEFSIRFRSTADPLAKAYEPAERTCGDDAQRLRSQL